MKTIMDVLGSVYYYLKNCLEQNRIRLNTVIQNRTKGNKDFFTNYIVNTSNNIQQNPIHVLFIDPASSKSSSTFAFWSQTPSSKLIILYLGGMYNISRSNISKVL